MFTGGTWVLVTEADHPTRHKGSTIGPEGHSSDSDLPVHTLAVFGHSGAVHWPVERMEKELASWDQVPGRRLV